MQQQTHFEISLLFSSSKTKKYTLKEQQMWRTLFPTMIVGEEEISVIKVGSFFMPRRKMKIQKLSRPKLGCDRRKNMVGEHFYWKRGLRREKEEEACSLDCDTLVVPQKDCGKKEPASFKGGRGVQPSEEKKKHRAFQKNCGSIFQGDFFLERGIKLCWINYKSGRDAKKDKNFESSLYAFLKIPVELHSFFTTPGFPLAVL